MRTWRMSKSVPLQRLAAAPAGRRRAARRGGSDTRGSCTAALPSGLFGGALFSISVRRCTCAHANRLRCVLSSTSASARQRAVGAVRDRDLLVRNQQRAERRNRRCVDAIAQQLLEIVAVVLVVARPLASSSSSRSPSRDSADPCADRRCCTGSTSSRLSTCSAGRSSPCTSENGRAPPLPSWHDTPSAPSSVAPSRRMKT